MIKIYKLQREKRKNNPPCSNKQLQIALNALLQFSRKPEAANRWNKN